MSGELLLINPAKRRKARKASSTKRRTRRVVRASNPAPARRRRVTRRRNPISAVRRRVLSRAPRRIGRRRRNPINLGSARTYMGMFKDAAIGAVGAVGMDMLWGQVNAKLPASMQNVPGTVDMGTAVKAVATVVVGMLLDKATKGLSRKAAGGALTVQFAEALRTVVPETMALGSVSPATRFNRGSNRISASGVQRAQAGSFMLGAAQKGSYMLGGAMATRESVVR